MMLHRLDGNMRAAEAHYSAMWRPEDFDACSKCGCDFADPDNDDHDPHAVQSKSNSALCCWCDDTMGDEE